MRVNIDWAKVNNYARMEGKSVAGIGEKGKRGRKIWWGKIFVLSLPAIGRRAVRREVPSGAPRHTGKQKRYALSCKLKT